MNSSLSAEADAGAPVEAAVGAPVELAVKLDAAVERLTPRVRTIARAILRGAPAPEVEGVLRSWPDGPSVETGIEAASPNAAAPAARIRAITDIRGVAALAPKGITGLGDGLNVIYGENASGKSSLARILQDIGTCHEAGAILANVFREEEEARHACVRIDVAGQERDVRWKPEEQSSIATLRVYDVNCGDSYVARGARALVLPGPAQRVAALANFLDELRGALCQWAEELDLACEFEPSETTEVGGAWKAGDEARLAELAAWTEIDTARLRLLELGRDRSDAQLADARDAWDTRIRAFDEAAALLSRVSAALRPEARAEFRERDRRIEELHREMESAKALGRLDAGSLRRLFAVAHDLAPAHIEEGFCPLCDRDFTTGELDAYRSQLERANTDAELELNELRLKQRLALGGWRELRDEASGLELDRAPRSQRWQQMALDLLERLLMGDAGDDIDLDDFDTRELIALVDATRDQRDALAALVEEGGDRSGELEELRWRKRLAEQADVLLKQLGGRKMADAMREEARTLGTRPFTTLQNELVDALLTVKYRDSLANCLAELLPHRPLELDSRGRKAQVQHVLALQSARKGTKTAAVLSDGERRMAGLAFFLTEAEVLGPGETLVFDDPVCSVDEVRRDRVARRLARLSHDRQVLVITHDLVFVEMLRRHTGEGAKLFQCRRAGVMAGIVTPGLDVALDIGHAVAAVRRSAERIEELEKLTGEEDQLEALGSESQAYRRALRVAVERIVEKRILRSVVKRFDRGVHTANLAQVSVTQEQQELVHELMNEASRELHDSSVALAPSCLDGPTARHYLDRLLNLNKISKGK